MNPFSPMNQNNDDDEERQPTIFEIDEETDVYFWSKRTRIRYIIFEEDTVAGANNDINVLDNSPLFNDLLDDKAPVAPYVVNGVGFEKGYYLAIYPQWATFVKSFTVANDAKHAYFKKRQEGARKDVERAFGVLQGRWGIIQQPARSYHVNTIRRVKMDDPNITMEEYIRLEEEKAQRHGRTFNWQTATFEKVKYHDDEDDCFTDFETEFPAIVFDNTLTSDTTLLCAPTDSKNDEILKPSSSKHTVDYLDDLDYFNYFKNKFPAIVCNVGLTSKPDLEIEPPVSSKHVSKSETSLSEYDEEEQNILHFSNSFPLDEIFPNDPKTIKDSDDNFDIAQPYGCNKVNRSNEI
ncbi:ALP1-like protein [Tanacetum coccineum]